PVGTRATNSRLPAGQSTAQLRRGVAGHTVALGVTAHARRHVATGLGPVMLRTHDSVGPQRLRWMKAPASCEVLRRAAQRDPHALVATEAERLRPMTRRAVGRVLASGDRVHRDEVIGMHVARAYSTVVTIGAVALGMAAGAELGVVGCHE